MLIAELLHPESEWQSIAKETYTEAQWRFLYDNWPCFDKGSYASFDKFYSEGQSYYFRSACKKTRLTYDEAAALEAEGIKLKIEGIAGTMLTKMRDRAPHDWDGRNIGEAILTGKVVQITLPDIGLMYINEVTWRDDCCTEEIQGLLEDGWRILAVCPPNAQRRPDYILGRKK